MTFARFAAVAFLLAALPAAAADVRLVPSGRAASESRPVGDFRSVSLSLPAEVTLKQGPAAPVAIEADDNLLPEIETAVVDGALRLRFRRSVSLSGRARIRLLVTSPAIEAISVSGSGDLRSEGVKSPVLAVNLGGSGDIRIARIEAERLKVALAGSGSFRAAGKAGEIAVKAAGSGDVDASRVEARQATVSIAGSGHVKVWASESLSVSAAGSGDVGYYGDPAVKRSIVGSGTVKRLGAAP